MPVRLIAVGAKFVDVSTRVLLPKLAFLQLPEDDDSISRLVKELHWMCPHVSTDSWKVFASWEAYDGGNGQPLELTDRVGDFGRTDAAAFIVEERNDDGHCHALNLVLGGSGTGKSRMLDEMGLLLAEAARLGKNEALAKRLESAYVFRISFDDGFPGSTQLIDGNCTDLDTSFRMLYQLYTGGESWPSFVSRMQTAYTDINFIIEEVVVLLAKLEKIEKRQDMTVLLCVDGLENLHHDGSMHSKYYRVMNAIMRFLNNSRAFVVCTCATRLSEPLHRALSEFQQQRVYLFPPTLNGDEILSPSAGVEKWLVHAMGGHGRALEVLDSALRRFPEGGKPADSISCVYDGLRESYADLFESPLLTNYVYCQEVVAAVLSGRQLNWSKSIGDTGLARTTVDELLSGGLFRLSRENHGHLSCAPFLLEILMWNLGNKTENIVTTSQMQRLGGKISSSRIVASFLWLTRYARIRQIILVISFRAIRTTTSYSRNSSVAFSLLKKL